MAEPIFGASFRSSSSSSGLRAVALISNDLAKMSLVKLLLDFVWRADVGLTRQDAYFGLARKAQLAVSISMFAASCLVALDALPGLRALGVFGAAVEVSEFSGFGDLVAWAVGLGASRVLLSATNMDSYQV